MITTSEEKMRAVEPEEKIIDYNGTARLEQPELVDLSRDQLVSEVVSLQRTVQELSVKRDLAAYEADRDAEVRALDLTVRELSDMAAPWEMFSAALTNKIDPRKEMPGLQLVSVPVAADWNDSEYGHYRAWRVLGDSMPDWGATYSASTQRQISAGYKIFLENLDVQLPDPEERRKAEKARRKYFDDLNELERARSAVGENWVNFDTKQKVLPENRRLSFDQWYAKFDGRKIAVLSQKTQLSAQEYTSYLVKAFGGYGFMSELLIAYDNEAYQLPAKSPDGLVQFYRTYNITPDLGDWIEEAKKASASGAPPDLSWSFTKNSERRHTSETMWGGSTSWFGGWWGFGFRSQGGSTSINTQRDQFRMAFDFQKFGLFSIQPSGWFNGTALQALQNGPWIPEGPVDTGRIKLWGPDGILNLMASAFVVAYRPKITVSLSQEEFLYVKSEFYAKGGFSIGPFGFGGSYGRKTEDVHFDASSNTITAQDSSDVPQIIAVVCSVLPNFK